MSIENHPNINAAGFTADIIRSFFEHLRGRANLNQHNRADASEVMHNEVVAFVTKISEKLDSTFGE